MIVLLIFLVLFLAVVGIAYGCYRKAFYNPRVKTDPERIDIPEGEIYEPFRELMTGWVRWTRTLPCEKVEITSHDGLRLVGKYYEYAPGPVLCFGQKRTDGRPALLRRK